MYAFLLSTLSIAVAEFGDKTQFLALLFGARFKRPLPILLGLLTSTILNHTLAAVVGVWISDHLGGTLLRWGLGLSFLGVALWSLQINSCRARPMPPLIASGPSRPPFSPFLSERWGIRHRWSPSPSR